jgi:hypothetical protein
MEVAAQALVAAEVWQLSPGGLVKNSPWPIICFAALLCEQPADVDTASTCTTTPDAISCTGILGTPEDFFEEEFVVTGGTDIDIQTLGFGGGTNAAGNSIPPGGFDSLIALFSGSPKTILTDFSESPLPAILPLRSSSQVVGRRDPWLLEALHSAGTIVTRWV